MSSEVRSLADFRVARTDNHYSTATAGESATFWPDRGSARNR